MSLRTVLTHATALHFLLCLIPALKGQDVDLLGKEPFTNPVMGLPFDLFPPDCVTLWAGVFFMVFFFCLFCNLVYMKVSTLLQISCLYLI